MASDKLVEHLHLQVYKVQLPLCMDKGKHNNSRLSSTDHCLEVSAIFWENLNFRFQIFRVPAGNAGTCLCSSIGSYQTCYCYVTDLVKITELVVCLTGPFSLSLLLTTKQIISPATSTFFLGRRSSQIGAVLVLNGQMSWHVILIFRIMLISKRAYRSRQQNWGYWNNENNPVFSKNATFPNLEH